jgi:glycosidase
MQWSADTNAGFTTGTPWRNPDANYAQVNVAAQEQDPDSLLNLYRTLAKLRAEHSVLRTGNITILETGNPGVYAALRSNADENILVLINLKGTPISDYALSLEEKLLSDGTFSARSLMDTTSAASLTVTGGMFTDYKPLSELPPYQAYIFQIN